METLILELEKRAHELIAENKGSFEPALNPERTFRHVAATEIAEALNEDAVIAVVLESMLFGFELSQGSMAKLREIAQEILFELSIQKAEGN